VFALIDCAKCKGTGKRGNGKCRACTSYSFDPRPAGKVWDYSNVASLKPCPACKGDWQRATLESFCDKAPAEVIDALPIRVYRQDRSNSWNEEHLGLGCLWSCTDYGRTAAGNDAEAIEEVRAGLAKHTTQATKIVKRFGRDATVAQVADALAIVITRNGYSVRAVFEGDTTVADAARELPPDLALTVGMAVFNAGGNGTLAAAQLHLPIGDDKA